jgi:hypothetical protein
VVLARVTLPASGNAPVAQNQVDNFVRRQLFSTAAIQDQVIRCCCGTQERRPARVTSINPPPGTVFTNANTVPPAVIATFSKNLQAATVSTTTFQVLRFVPGTPSVLLPGQVTYDDGNRSARFTPNTPFTVPGVYQVTIVGSGPSSILDSDNLALDGNDDGQPGGNFLSQFTVTIPQPTPTPSPTTVPTTPLTARLVGPSPVPTVPAGQPATTGDLQIILNGGTAGQDLQMNISVVLNTSLVRTAGPARCIDETTGDSVDGAIASGNSYVFTAVKTVQPGTGAPRVLRITSMTVQTTLPPSPAPTTFTVQALVSLASATPVPINPTSAAVLLIAPQG